MVNELKYASANIKLLLMSKGWTQGILCKKTGMTPITMHRRLNEDSSKWTMTEAINVSKALGVPIQDIFFTIMVPTCNTDEKAC